MYVVCLSGGKSCSCHTKKISESKNIYTSTELNSDNVFGTTVIYEQKINLVFLKNICTKRHYGYKRFSKPRLKMENIYRN